MSSAYKFLNQGNQLTQQVPYLVGEDSIQSGMLHLVTGKEAVLTQENLKKRKLSLCSRCYLCGEEDETVSHLFVQCRITT